MSKITNLRAEERPRCCAGIDFHKRYSQVHVIDERGRTCATARLANDFRTVHGFFSNLAERCRAVVEAGWKWGVMYDWLDAIENVSAVELAHPYRVRAIAAAQVKTDSNRSPLKLRLAVRKALIGGNVMPL
jgi:hypothetical protein